MAGATFRQLEPGLFSNSLRNFSPLLRARNTLADDERGSWVRVAMPITLVVVEIGSRDQFHNEGRSISSLVMLGRHDADLAFLRSGVLGTYVEPSEKRYRHTLESRPAHFTQCAYYISTSIPRHTACSFLVKSYCFEMIMISRCQFDWFSRLVGCF